MTTKMKKVIISCGLFVVLFIFLTHSYYKYKNIQNAWLEWEEFYLGRETSKTKTIDGQLQVGDGGIPACSRCFQGKRDSPISN